MKKKLKPIPQFNSEQEEADFWMDHDTTEYVDWSGAKVGLFPNLRATSKLISLRLPVSIIDSARVEANKRDMPYQSLIKQVLYWVFVQRGIDKQFADGDRTSDFFSRSTAELRNALSKSGVVDKARRK